MILVIGATGTNGREVVARLSAAGRPVRALVRDPARAAKSGLSGPGVELEAGDLDDVASLSRAFQGVERALVLTAVDVRHVAWVRNAVEAALAAGVGHVVKFSALGARADSSAELLRQHAESDALVESSGLAFTILRPNAFHQNLLWSAGSVKSRGVIYAPVNDARLSFVDVRDLADVAAAALLGPGHEGKVYEITGPEALSYADLAATLSDVLGKPVQSVNVSLEAAEASMRQSGMPEWNARAVAGLFGYFATGAAAGVNDTIASLLGRPPIRFADFARDHAEAFR
jgi:uncharacterized protein YbjT (DUF2867 family)